MKTRYLSPLLGLLLALLLLALVLINNLLTSGIRVDLTEDSVYSLAPGSQAIIASLDEPVNLYLFYSDKASTGMTALRNYAARVEAMLDEYAKASKGKVHLRVIDPEPFSEAEDRAAEYGLTAAAMGSAGDPIYFGLVGTNSLDGQEVIAFLDPEQEAFLQYQVSKLIYRLSNPEPLQIGIVSGLPIQGGPNPMGGPAQMPWVFYTQLKQLYDVTLLSGHEDSLPDDLDVLMLVHPRQLSDGMTYAIDQYLMGGGKLLAFIDPHSESDPMGAMAALGGANASQPQSLLSKWGIDASLSQVVLDAANGLEIRAPSGEVVRHLGYLGLGVEDIDRKDVVTAELESINGASFGTLGLSEGSRLRMVPLLQSSAHAAITPADGYAAIRDPKRLSEDFTPNGKPQILAARFSGPASSAFSEAPEGMDAAKHILDAQNIQLLVVADTDLLADRFWVSQSNFFGQMLYSPFANNGDFVVNSTENYGGSDALIGIRSRGTFARPFTRVEALMVAAEDKFREQQRKLQRQLEETEQQLRELQNQGAEAGALVLTPEQGAAIDSFIKQRSDIRKALREVQHQLDKDIERLGSTLKFVNVVAAPLLLVGLLMLVARLLTRRARSSQ